MTALVACAPIGCDRDDDAKPSEVALADIEDEFGEAYCERMFECRCEQYRWFESVDECRSNLSADVDRIGALRQTDEIVYDPACVGQRLDALDALGCAAELDLPPSECGDRCPIFHGARGVGDSCTTDGYGDYSECAAALRCNIDTCDYDPNTGEESCTGQCEDPCAPNNSGGCGDCDEESFCSWESSRCEPLPTTGETCEISGRCVGGSFCDATALCVPLVARGDACSGHRQCDSGYCPAGTCAELPARGDDCAGTNACADGLQCDNETLVCVDADALICQSPSGLETYY